MTATEQLHAQPDAIRNDEVEQDDGGADRHDGQGVAHTPEQPGCRSGRDTHAAELHNRRDGDDVIGIGRVPHAKKEAERDNDEHILHHTPADRASFRDSRSPSRSGIPSPVFADNLEISSRDARTRYCLPRLAESNSAAAAEIDFGHDATSLGDGRHAAILRPRR